MCCAICCCVLFHTRGPSPITNYLTMQLTAPPFGLVPHITHSHVHVQQITLKLSNATRKHNCDRRPHYPVAAGRSELPQPDKPSFDPLRPFEQYIRSQFAALDAPNATEQLRKDVPSLSANFSNLALHSPAIVAAAAALTKSPSTSVAPPSDNHGSSLAENQVIMRQKHHQYLRSQPPQQAATAASSVQQPPPPPLETHFDRTSNNQTSGNNSRNNRRIGRHESRYTSGNDEHSYFWSLLASIV